jgi:hypothetical protein
VVMRGRAPKGTVLTMGFTLDGSEYLTFTPPPSAPHQIHSVFRATRQVFLSHCTSS